MHDRYTKTILTVIATMLTIIAFENIHFPKEAHAQTFSGDMPGAPGNPAHVIIDGVDSTFSMTGIPVHPVQ